MPIDAPSVAIVFLSWRVICLR